MQGRDLGPVGLLAAVRRRYYVVLTAVAANERRRLSAPGVPEGTVSNG